MSNLSRLEPLQKLPPEYRRGMEVVAHVLPFRANNYVVEELIDWDRVPNDPIFQLTFPQPGMLAPDHFRQMQAVLESGAGAVEVRAAADRIRRELNPHPAGQLQHNVPMLEDQPVPGVQHKYAETCLVFPAAGQTCHAYCTFCFRWAQFVGMADMKLATDESMRFCEYLRRHREVTDVLITGGDPMIMRAEVLARYLEPLLAPEMEHIHTIRIGTKSLGYWPYRYLAEDDSDDLLRLLEKVTSAGKHLAVMAHFSHWRELDTQPVHRAIRRLQGVGATIRTQSPVVRRINDDAGVWSRMWQTQVQLGCLPYYMFVERETGAHCYFKVPLHRALEIYREAIGHVSGLARSARGPVMSALPGKVAVDGTLEIDGTLHFVLSFLQARDPAWCKRPFLAQFDPLACWLTDLRPPAGATEFFYETKLRDMLREGPERSNADRQHPAQEPESLVAAIAV